MYDTGTIYWYPWSVTCGFVTYGHGTYYGPRLPSYCVWMVPGTQLED